MDRRTRRCDWLHSVECPHSARGTSSGSGHSRCKTCRRTTVTHLVFDRRQTFGRFLCVLLRFIVRRPADAVQLLAAASILATLAVVAHKVLQLLGFFLCDADACAVEPVGAQVAADVKPARKTQLLRPASDDVEERVGAERTWTRRRAFCRYSTVWCPSCDLLR